MYSFVFLTIVLEDLESKHLKLFEARGAMYIAHNCGHDAKKKQGHSEERDREISQRNLEMRSPQAVTELEVMRIQESIRRGLLQAWLPQALGQEAVAATQPDPLSSPLSTAFLLFNSLVPLT